MPTFKLRAPSQEPVEDAPVERTQRIQSGKVGIRGKIQTAQREVLHEEEGEEPLPASSEFPVNCPRVGAAVSIKLSANYQSIEVNAWVELPVKGFTKEAVLNTHSRAFSIAEDKAVEKAEGLKDLLKSL